MKIGLVTISCLGIFLLSTSIVQADIPAEVHFTNHLKQGVVMSVPNKLTTVKSVANYLLTPTGYSLVISSNEPQQTAAILSRSPSQLGNSNALVTVEKALLLIAGNDVDLVVDHKNKYVTYFLHKKEETK